MKDGSSLVVTPSSIPNFVTRGPDTDLSSDEGSKKVFEDSDDEPVVKTWVSDSNVASDDDEQEAKAMGMYPLPLLSLLLLSSYHFLAYLFLYSACRSCHTLMDMPEESKATVGPPMMPTTPISTTPTTLTPTGPSNFLTLIPSSIKTFVIAPIYFLHLVLKGLCCALYSLSGPSPAKVALTFQFKIGSSFAIIPYPMSEAATFLTRFE